MLLLMMVMMTDDDGGRLLSLASYSVGDLAVGEVLLSPKALNCRKLPNSAQPTRCSFFVINTFPRSPANPRPPNPGPQTLALVDPCCLDVVNPPMLMHGPTSKLTFSLYLLA